MGPNADHCSTQACDLKYGCFLPLAQIHQALIAIIFIDTTKLWTGVQSVPAQPVGNVKALACPGWPDAIQPSMPPCRKRALMPAARRRYAVDRLTSWP